MTIVGSCKSQENKDYFKWSDLAQLPSASGQKEPLGVAGAFIGVQNNVLIVAGGTNFPQPVWESQKVWYDNIWVLIKEKDNSFKWVDGGKLDQPLAYGASISTNNGVICIGGNNSKGFYADVFRLSWDDKSNKVLKYALPGLPIKCAYGSAARIGDVIYLAGGTSDFGLETAMNNFWELDLSKEKDGTDNFKWKVLPSWPGPPRAFNLTVAQFNGRANCIYVISGRCKKKGTHKADSVQFLSDIYEFSPFNTDYDKNDRTAAKNNIWRKRAEVPRCVMAGTCVAIGQSHIFVFGGADGSLFLKADKIKNKHPGYPKDIFAYHTITDTWVTAGKLPINQVTTTAVKWGNSVIIPSGEIRPRVCTPKIFGASLIKNSESFGILNFVIIVTYLLAMVAIGFFFSKRNKNTEDFFRGGQRLPWWASGMSIFATMLSSITFIAIPAKAFATNWVFFIINMTIVLITPFVVFFILPFFWRIDATSAYEYLEKRFNVVARLFASASFILFQIGRMAIVMFLPALALATIMPISIQECILIMGILSIIYCTMGGLEAVIWTDTIQSFVLLGGALLSLVLIMTSIKGGLNSFFSIAISNQKFHMINWDWSSISFVTTAFWVVLLGGIGQNIVSYTSDQGVVQRYMSVSDPKRAAKAIWTNAITVVPASLIFFGVGTALFVFYKTHPSHLDPAFQTDAIFPLFISHELPPGIAGLVVAGIFAAAQSTVSTSMNSMSAAIVTDFIQRFNLLKSEKGYLILARVMTFALGCLGTALALLFASSDIKSLWDSFMAILGLFGGSMGGLFLLGIFTKRTNAPGAVIGAIMGALGLAIVEQRTEISFLLYATIGIVFCFIIGYLTSFIIPAKRNSIDGLTIYTLKKSIG